MHPGIYGRVRNSPLTVPILSQVSPVQTIHLASLIILFNTGSSKNMDGIWNRYNLKSTRRIYTFGVLKRSEQFEVLDPPQYISICAPFVALETSKRNSISCHVFWIMSRVTVSMADVILSCRCSIFRIFSAYTMYLMHPHRKKIKWREIWASRWPGYLSTPSNPGIRESLI